MLGPWSIFRPVGSAPAGAGRWAGGRDGAAEAALAARLGPVVRALGGDPGRLRVRVEHFPLPFRRDQPWTASCAYDGPEPLVRGAFRRGGGWVFFGATSGHAAGLLEDAAGAAFAAAATSARAALAEAAAASSAWDAAAARWGAPARCRWQPPPDWGVCSPAGDALGPPCCAPAGRPCSAEAPARPPPRRRGARRG